MQDWFDPAEVQELTGYRRPSAQRAWLDRNAIPYYVSGSGRPIIIRTDYANWLNPPPEIADQEPFVVPPLDEAAVYLPMSTIFDRRKKYSKGHGFIGSGVYFLFDAGELLYVGLSKQVNWRLWTHFIKRVDNSWHAIWFDEVSVIEVPEYWLAKVELFYIQRERPPRNIKDVPCKP